MIRDSECKAKHLETMLNFEQELSRLRHKFQAFCTNEGIRATKASMKRKVSVQGARPRKRAKTFSRGQRSQNLVDPSVNSPPAKKQRGRKSMVKLRQQQRDKKRYKAKKALILDPSMPEPMRKIVATVRSKNSRKRKISVLSSEICQTQSLPVLKCPLKPVPRRKRRILSPPVKCPLKLVPRRKRRILEEDLSSEDEQ
jgi:hypothetical protein